MYILSIQTTVSQASYLLESDMIENEDMATTPRPIAHDNVTPAPATIQVPAAQTATVPPANPFVDVDDLLALQMAGDPQISPDGSLIAFTVLQCNEKANTTSGAIWLVESKDAKAHTPRRMTSAGL